MNINNEVEVVITSFNQKSMIYEAVRSLYCQTTRPKRIIIVDDGSTDELSVNILNEIEADRNILVIRQSMVVCTRSRVNFFVYSANKSSKSSE